MNNFIFENATKVLFGKGCVKEYLVCLTKGCGDTVMLAYGGGSIKKNGIYDEVVSILEGAGKRIVEFSGIMANPTYAKVLEGAKLARESQAGLVLGVGGGSVMDCCKAVSIAARYDGDVWEDFWARPGIFDFEPLPLGVIVTVAGTGSECNGGAVITNEELKIKTGRDYPKCNPRFALLDPTYTYIVPKFQMVSGGFDILSHIMEIYFSGYPKSQGLYCQEQPDVGCDNGGEPDYQAWQAHRFPVSPDGTPAWGIYGLQPRSGAGGSSSNILPPYLQEWV